MSRNAGSTDWTRPGQLFQAVTPSDVADIAPCRGIYVGAGGDLTIIGDTDTDETTFVDLAPGIIHPISARRVLATGTTAAGIVAVY